MGCGNEKLSKYLTQTFTAHCNAMICQQVTLLGDAEWPKVADAVIEAGNRINGSTPASGLAPPLKGDAGSGSVIVRRTSMNICAIATCSAMGASFVRPKVRPYAIPR